MIEELPTLYSRTQTGAIQQWTVKIQNNTYWTEYGQIDGKQTITTPTVAQSTNLGRSNERTENQQALFEAKALWKKKKESGCWEDIGDIDRVAFIEPMLAQNYNDRKDQLTFPLYVQPKLDGNRCVTSINGMQSRNGKPINSCPHIFNKLSRLGVFKKYLDLKLDGELYCDKLANNFNKICSIIKKKKPTENELMEADATIQYWIYDIVDTTKKFSERNQFIQKLFKDFNLDNSFVYVPTILVNDQATMDKLFEGWVENGYEGQMVRVDDVYEQKRSEFLLKRKQFQDREYLIIDVCEGNGNKTGMAGYMILQNDNQTTFKSNIKGDRKYLRELLENKMDIIGKQATVKFFNLTPDNVPRFPYVIAVRDYE